MTTSLIDFYSGHGTDSRGRTLDEIQSWDFDRLEDVHDYIQWMFPLRERSAVQPQAPVLDDEQIATFRSSDDLRRRLRESLDVMLRFYGFVWHGDEIGRSSDWPTRSTNWITRGNHNHLRLTRILKSLSALGLEVEARALQTALLREADLAGHDISRTTRAFWEHAVPRG